ncbi:hypothetical protein ACLVWQ_10060 (plasmid) [Streptomyces sp. CWNU-52B]|uniref:hypothetical protein n=1 Tax=unclassified Streptomyces TaxID=2593676 RepID=UPI0039C15E4B
MSAGALFNREEIERRLGPAAVAAAKRNAAAAPPFRPEQIAFLRALFASVRIAGPKQGAAADAPCGEES